MKTIAYESMDKRRWGEGPWQKEPDKIQFVDGKTNLPCLVVRGSFHGALCGYVGVSKAHPAFEVDYHELSDRLSVHTGSINFSGKCMEQSPAMMMRGYDVEKQGICHTVEDDEDDDVWWLGFSTDRWGDLSPAENDMARARYLFREEGEVYRDLEYVTKEIESLALQLSGMEG